MRAIMGILTPEAGEIWYHGKPLTAEVRRRFGYMPEERGLYPKMTAREQLYYLLQLKGLPRATAAQEVAYWEERLAMPWIDRLARSLSKGMQQKVQLILALAGNPPVLLLDEPFSGLDPIVSQEVETLLREKAQAGTLIILSTHRLEQVDHLCDYVLLIHRGRLLLEGETQMLRRRLWRRTYEIELNRPLHEVSLPEKVSFEALTPYRATITLPNTLSANDLLAHLLPQTSIRFFAEKLPTIRQIFFEVVGET